MPSTNPGAPGPTAATKTTLAARSRQRHAIAGASAEDFRKWVCLAKTERDLPHRRSSSRGAEGTSTGAVAPWRPRASSLKPSRQLLKNSSGTATTGVRLASGRSPPRGYVRNLVYAGERNTKAAEETALANVGLGPSRRRTALHAGSVAPSAKPPNGRSSISSARMAARTRGSHNAFTSCARSLR